MNIQDLELMGTGDVCQLLGVSRSRLIFLIKQYEIPYKEVSSGKVFLKGDIEAFMNSPKRLEGLKHSRKKDKE